MVKVTVLCIVLLMQVFLIFYCFWAGTTEQPFNEVVWISAAMAWLSVATRTIETLLPEEEE